VPSPVGLTCYRKGRENERGASVLAVVGTVLWLLLVGALWYVRPPDLVWLLGSVVLGVCYFSALMWYVSRGD
jgi:hypothetical protein